MPFPYIRSQSTASEDVVRYELAFLQPTPTADVLDEEHRSSSDFEDLYTKANQENEYQLELTILSFGEVKGKKTERKAHLAHTTRRVDAQ
jgi:hypothetical protein